MYSERVAQCINTSKRTSKSSKLSTIKSYSTRTERSTSYRHFSLKLDKVICDYVRLCQRLDDVRGREGTWVGWTRRRSECIAAVVATFPTIPSRLVPTRRVTYKWQVTFALRLPLEMRIPSSSTILPRKPCRLGIKHHNDNLWMLGPRKLAGELNNESKLLKSMHKYREGNRFVNSMVQSSDGR